MNVASDNFYTRITSYNQYTNPRIVIGVPDNGRGRVGLGIQSCFRLNNIKVYSSGLVQFNVRFKVYSSGAITHGGLLSCNQ